MPGYLQDSLAWLWKTFIHLAEKKAEKIGAETVVSTSYREYVQEREDYAKANFYLYISKSKNGLMQLELMEI